MVQTQADAKYVTLDHFIVDRLGFFRRMRGFTVKELARRARIDEGYLGKVLRGDRGLRADEFLRLCFVLNVDFDEFCPVGVIRDLGSPNPPLEYEPISF